MSKEVMKLALEALQSCDAAHITDGGRQWYDEKLVDKAVEAIEKALAERPAVSAGPITPAMMQGPTPEQKSQMVAAMSKLAEPPAQQEYERGFIDGMQEQMKRSVDRAVNAMAQRTWVGLTDEEKTEIRRKTYALPLLLMEAIEAKLKEKNA